MTLTFSSTDGISLRAHDQWRNRPDDERFATLGELHADALRDANASYSIEVSAGDLHASDNGEGGLVLVAGKDRFDLTNFAFDQTCTRVGCPPSYLSKIPAPLAARCLEDGLTSQTSDLRRELYITPDRGHFETHRLRSVLSDRYQRIHDSDVTERLLEMQSNGWKVPPSAGSKPAGLYRGERDLFAFLIDGGSFLDEPGKGGADGGLHRGVFVSNSEVGYRKLNVTTFLHRGICGNHIVWGLENAVEIDLIHTGDIREEWTAKVSGAVEAFAASSAKKDLERISAAQTICLGANKDEVLDTLFGLGGKIRQRAVFTEKRLRSVYEVAEKHADTDGAPNTAWGIVNGFTRFSQEERTAEQRTKIDAAAGKLLAYVTN